MEWPVIWDTMAPMLRHCNGIYKQIDGFVQCDSREDTAVLQQHTDTSVLYANYMAI